MGNDPSRLARYREAVLALPPLWRQVFLRHCVEERDYFAIAARLKMDVGDVERALAQALAQIDRALDDLSDMD